MSCNSSVQSPKKLSKIQTEINKESSKRGEELSKNFSSSVDTMAAGHLISIQRARKPGIHPTNQFHESA